MSQALLLESASKVAVDPRQALREGTWAHHERVDTTFSRFDLTDRDGYAAFLLAQEAAFIPVEASLERSGISSLLHNWPERRRSHLLVSDLAVLGLTPPTSSDFPPFETEAALLGAVYVLEGSRLGGRLLARSIDADWPQQFLTPGDPGLWRSLIAFLAEELVSEASLNEAIASACSVFEVFERAGMRLMQARC